MIAPVSPAPLPGPLGPTVHAVAASPWVSLAYLVAGVCFILALRGLSSPTTSQRGNRFGMIGMAIAVVTTLVTHVPFTSLGASNNFDDRSVDWIAILEILAAIGLGALIGITTARRIAMTAMPQLVAAFHSLVGLAAVAVACAAFLNPVAFDIADLVVPLIGQPFASIHVVSRVEMALGVAIGAITFSGSVRSSATLCSQTAIPGSSPSGSSHRQPSRNSSRAGTSGTPTSVRAMPSVR